MSENALPRSIWWGRGDWLIFVPWFLVLASFWIYLVGPDRAPWTEAMHEFYGRRHTAEIHTPWVMFGSMLIFLYSFTLFLRHRLLFGRLARSWTIAGYLVHLFGNSHRRDGREQLLCLFSVKALSRAQLGRS